MAAAPKTLLHVYPSFATGGAQVRFAAIANRFGPRWRHLILAMDGDLSARERLAPGLDIRFPTLDLPKGATFANAWRCRAALRAWAPDALFTTNWGAIEWAMGNLPGRCRHVHIEEGIGPDELGGQLRRRVWTRRLVLRRSTVVVPSRVLERRALDVWRLPRAGVRYVPNGIDLARFTPRTGARGGVPVIGTVAALRPEKNIGRLLHAFARLRAGTPARLVIVGEGAERPSLTALAATLGVGGEVIFTGHDPRPEAAYAGFDIFALSSDSEQMPFSVLEAMAAGLPVAATDVGDVREMLAGENAAFITPPDAAALAAALARLAADPAGRQRVGAANRARAEAHFDQETMFETWAGIFDGREG